MSIVYAPEELVKMLADMVSLPAETERFEFKEGNELDNRKIGEYFSALSNEANLKGKEFGWLIFGVNDKTHALTGSSFREGDRKRLDDLKKAIYDLCDISFVEIYEVNIDEKRIVFLQIPPAIKGYPTKCNGHAFGRNGEHIGALDDYKRQTIEAQGRGSDWSSEVINGLTLDDIDDDAIVAAKEGYIKKHTDLNPEIIRSRDKKTFLTKIYALQDGKITKACAVLFGKSESITMFFPWLEISWILKDNHGNNITFEHFKAPFVRAASQILEKIRVINHRILLDSGLVPIDVPSYDKWVLRELLANAICHQDYTKEERIVIQEFPEYLIISNGGRFYSGSIQKVVEQTDFIPPSYRNPCLKNVMSEIKMIEYAGSGLRKVFMKQRENYMPLPEDLSTDHQVKIRIDGKIINENYTRLLHKRKDLSLLDIIYLDSVQKKKDIEKHIASYLRRKKLIEGRKGHYHLSLGVAQNLGEVPMYLDIKGPEIDHQRERIYAFIKAQKKGGCSKKNIVDFMSNKIEEHLSDKEKDKRIGNLLQDLRREGKIQTDNKGAHAKWFVI